MYINNGWNYEIIRFIKFKEDSNDVDNKEDSNNVDS